MKREKKSYCPSWPISSSGKMRNSRIVGFPDMTTIGGLDEQGIARTSPENGAGKKKEDNEGRASVHGFPRKAVAIVVSRES